MSFLTGKKTYIIAAASTVFAAIGYATGHLDAAAAYQIVMTSGLGATLRQAIGS